MEYRKRRGFTLVEIMIVVVIIGLLAAAAIPTFISVSKGSTQTRFINDVRVFKSAIETFYLENGTLPVDSGTGTLHAQMNGYISPGPFSAASSIGGRWDIEANDSGIALGVGVVGYTITSSELLEIDTKFDDGNLTTGRLRDIVSGSRFYWVIE
jgi:prepilin-type N-terminal cleavage/methylation domain-containing protein|tara:strand:- start:172 stop:633 length:462 start_codon:yes stop_codon:yes gene_type:complete